MKDFIRQLSNKFKSVYLVWIVFNFILLMVGGGIFNTYNYGGFLRYNNDFFPFGRFFHFGNYDYTEFLVYTIVPFFLYYAYWIWSKDKRNELLFRMKLPMEKIIAREFLLLILAAAFGLSTFLFTYANNAYWQYQVDNVSTLISEKSILWDSLARSFSLKAEKQAWLYYKYSNTYDMKEYSKEKLWSRLDDLAKKDSIQIRWIAQDQYHIDFLKKIGFDTPDKFKKFIEANRISSEEYSYKKNINILISKKDNFGRKILSYQEQTDLGLQILSYFSILFFPIRYLFLCIKWSIKILKEKSV